MGLVRLFRRRLTRPLALPALLLFLGCSSVGSWHLPNIPGIPGGTSGLPTSGTEVVQRAEDIVLREARATLDEKLGLKDARAQRAMSSGDKRNAASARRIVERQGYRPLEVYNPRDAAGKARFLAEYRAAMQAVKGKRTVTDAQLVRIARSMVPFLRFLAAAGERPNTLVLLPGERRSAAFGAFCMDHNAGLPRAGEKLQLRRTSTLIDAEGLPIYTALMRYSASHSVAHYQMQNLVWGLRHADEQPPFLAQPSAETRALLNAAQPGLAARWEPYVRHRQIEGAKTRAKRELLERGLGFLQRQAHVTLPSPSASGYSVTDTRSALEALARIAPEGDMTPDSEYTLLAPNVAARAVDRWAFEPDIEIVNASCSPYIFDGADYSGVSTRVSQQEALGGVTPPPEGVSKGYTFHPPWAGDGAFAALAGQVGASVAAGTLSTAGRALGRLLTRMPRALLIGGAVAAVPVELEAAAVTITGLAVRYLGQVLIATLWTEEQRPPAEISDEKGGQCKSSGEVSGTPPGEKPPEEKEPEEPKRPRKLNPFEKQMFDELRAEGKSVEIVPTEPGSKTPDFIVDGVKTELKNLTEMGPDTMKNALERAVKQGDNIIIDARSIPADRDYVVTQISRAEGNVGSLRGRVRVLIRVGEISY
jgi:Contact-dependent growth inhibition CdiA C-terminal domain